LKEIISKAKKILVATDTSADFDSLCAAISLAKVLHNSEKKVSLLIPDGKYVQRVLKLFPTMDIKLVLKEEPENFILSVPKDGAVVKDVKWKEENGKINIFVTTEKGELKETQIIIKPNYALFDLIIIIGVSNLADLGEFYKKNQKIFSRNKILQIGALQKRIGLHRFGDDSSALSEAVYKFIHTTAMNADGEIYTDLLAGILWKTDGLNRVEDELIVSSIVELIELGANIKQASKNAFKNISLQDTRLLQEILKNLEVGDEEIIFSVIKSSNKKSLLPKESISSVFPMLDRLEKFQTGVVLFEEQNGVFGVISTKNSKHNALDLAKAYNPKGNSYTASFTTADSIDEIKAVLTSAAKKGGIAKKGVKKNGGSTTKNSNTSDSQKDTSPSMPSDFHTAEPLQAAEKTPKPLDLGTKETEDTSGGIMQPRGGFTPPPPINPLPPADE